MRCGAQPGSPEERAQQAPPDPCLCRRAWCHARWAPRRGTAQPRLAPPRSAFSPAFQPHAPPCPPPPPGAPLPAPRSLRCRPPEGQAACGVRAVHANGGPVHHLLRDRGAEPEGHLLGRVQRQGLPGGGNQCQQLALRSGPALGVLQTASLAAKWTSFLGCLGSGDDAVLVLAAGCAAARRRRPALARGAVTPAAGQPPPPAGHRRLDRRLWRRAAAAEPGAGFPLAVVSPAAVHACGPAVLVAPAGLLQPGRPSKSVCYKQGPALRTRLCAF